MKSLIDFNVFAKLFTSHGTAVLKLDGTINASAASTVYIQVHDSQAAPSNGAVPLMSWSTTPTSEFYKEFKSGELRVVNGLYVAVSTTQATLTLGTGSNKFDAVRAELDEAEHPSSVTVVGDLTTTTQSQQVWAESAGPKRLVRAQIAFGGAGGQKYAMLFAKDSPADGDTPICTIAQGDAATVDCRFGDDGREVFSLSSDGTRRVGCTIAISITAGVLTAGSAANKVRAEYK